jgi:hypothetical protein
MKHFWYEKWLGDSICIYCGSTKNIKVGAIIGMENALYLGCFVIGLDLRKESSLK